MLGTVGVRWTTDQQVERLVLHWGHDSYKKIISLGQFIPIQYVTESWPNHKAMWEDGVML